MMDRLTKSDWIAHGLKALAQNGPQALKVGKLAAELNVSRGSFYWHFKDIAEFKALALQHWQNKSTEQVIRSLDSQPAPDRLPDLLRRTFTAQRNLDHAVRAWAADDSLVAEAVAQADTRRIDFICELIASAGVDKQEAFYRAQFLYWAFLGQAMIADKNLAKVPEAFIDRISAEFLRPTPAVRS